MCRNCRLCSKYSMNSVPEILHIKEEGKLLRIYGLQLSDTYVQTCCSTPKGTKRNSSRVGYDCCRFVKTHRSFRENCCLHIHVLKQRVTWTYVKMEAKISFETSVTIENWQGVTSQKTWIFFSTTTGTSNLTSQCTATMYEGWNFNSGNYLFTTDTK